VLSVCVCTYVIRKKKQINNIGNDREHTFRNLKKSGALLYACSSTVTGLTDPSTLYPLSTPSTVCTADRNPQLIALLVAAHRTRLPAPSRLAAAPPSRVEPRHVCRCSVLHPSQRPLRLVAPYSVPAPYALCPILRHVEVLSMPLFPTRRSCPLSTPPSPQRSISACDITRSGVARPGVGFSGFLDVASVCFKCFRCFICTLQVFHVDITKIDRDVAYVAMAIHVYCKAFVLNVSAVSYGCCTCVYLGVTYISH
jgi:hypothetical protein